MKKESLKVNVIFKSLIPTIIMIFLQIMASIFVIGFYAMDFMNNNRFSSMKDFSNKLLKLGKEMSSSPYIYITYSIVGIFIMLIMLFNKIDMHKNFDIKKLKGKVFLYIVLLGFFLQIVTSYLMTVCILFIPEEGNRYIKLMEDAGIMGNINPVMIFYAVLLGPICEELTFRGLTMYYASKGFSFWTANIIQSCMFAIFHMNIIQGIYAFLIGIVLGYIYHITSSIIVPIVLHILFNGMSGLVSTFVDLSSKNPVTFCVVLIIGIYGTYFAIKSLNKTKKVLFTN